jgi:hypothetical protein
MDVKTDILIWTSLGFSIPIFLYPNLPRYFKLLLSYMTFASFCFWLTNEPYGFFHRIDSIMVRISIASVVLYKVLVYRKNLFCFLWLSSIVLCCFYMSDISSNDKWGSEAHVGYHALAHVFSILAMLVGLTSSL